MRRLIRILPSICGVAVLAVCAMLLLSAAPKASVSTPVPIGAQDKRAEQWADSIMEHLTEEQRVAQLFVPRLDITNNTSGLSTLKKMVAEYGVGGILLGKGTAESYADINNHAQEYASVPVLITLDGEWGPAMRVSDAPRFPHNMALGAIQDAQLLHDYGREVARECRALGIQVDFAPVLDVNSNPENPVIGYRSFGEDPKRVAMLGSAYCAGMESGGVMAVGKHFPGHGDTSTDSHKALTEVNHDLNTINNIDLVPFRAAIDAGMSGIMIGHLRVKSLDKSGTPASLSKKITTDLLQSQMKFDGLIFTDALVMKGAAIGKENNCVSALRAGADVLLNSASPIQDIQAVVKAVKSGKISQSEIDRRCRKMLIHKYRLGLTDYAPIDIRAAKATLNSNDAYDLIERLAKASITILKNDDYALPVRGLSSRRIVVVNIGAKASNEFSDYCARYAQVSTIGLEAGTFSAGAIEQIKTADVVITGVFTNAAWAQKAFSVVRNAARENNFIPTFFVNPYKMADFGNLSQLPTLVAAGDDVPALRRAAAEALFGGIDVTGRFPVNVDGVAALGAGLDVSKSRLDYAAPKGKWSELNDSIEAIANRCVEKRAFPGCQVMVVKDGEVVVDGNYGTLDYGEGSPKVTCQTLYDLASVTKATATVAGIMKVYDEGLLDLDASVAQYIPQLIDTDKSGITVRQLLTHESGMPAVINVYKLMVDTASYTAPLFRLRCVSPYTIRVDADTYANENASLRTDLFHYRQSEDYDTEVFNGVFGRYDICDTIMQSIYNQKLGAKRYLYSCLNFCLLMNIEENLTGVAHDQWVQTEVFGPLGAWRTGFRPTTYYDRDLIAPTESDEFLRNQVLQGFVHDEIAAFSGGVQGNAGLFSTADDVAKLCQTWLQGGVYGGEQIFDESTVKLFTTTKSPTCERGLGFDRLSGYRSMASVGAPASVYGHTGFTGTCFWVDPENDIIVVFLSNRVHPTRTSNAFNNLSPRRAIMEQVYKSLL